MYYLIGLKDLRSGFEQELEVTDDMPLSAFLDEVRKTMDLPYDEYVYYRKTLGMGKIFMQNRAVIEEHLSALSSGGDDPNDLYRRSDIYRASTYRSEEGVSVADMFTVIGSAITYDQGRYSIRCTLVDRDD